MAGVHSAQIPYYCAKNGSEIFLWNASGRNIVSDSGLRAAGFISDGGYMVVQNVQNGLYGVWSAEKGQLTVPCRYQSVRLLTGQYEGAEAPPPEIVVAATMDGYGRRCVLMTEKCSSRENLTKFRRLPVSWLSARVAEPHITICEKERQQYRKRRRTAVR